MIQFLVLSLNPNCCKAQDQHACQVLEKFLADKNVQQYLQLGERSSGQLVVMDSSGAMKHCPGFMVGQVEVKLEGFDRTLNLDLQNRKDLPRWQRKVLVYKYEVTDKYREIFFFYKPNNAVGSVKYKISDKGVTVSKYNLGQI